MEDKAVSQRIQSEKYVVGMLVWSKPEYADMISVDDFKDDSAKFIVKTIKDFREKNEPVNEHSVYCADGMNEHIVYLSSLVDFFHIGVDDESTMLKAINRICEMSDVRFLYNGLNKITDDVKAGTLKSSDTIIDSMQSLQDKTISRHIRSSDMMVGDSIIEGFNLIALNKKGGKIKLGLPTIDAFMGGGINRGEYVVVAARTNMGKSILSIIPSLIAASNGQWVMVCSNEMTRAQMGLRMLCNKSGVRMSVIEQNAVGTDADYRAMSDATQQLKRATIMMVPDCYYVSQIRERLEKKQKEGIPVSLVVLDHIQRMKSENPRVTKEYEVLTEVSRAIQALAKKYNCVIIAMAQLSREGLREGRVSLEFIKGSGSLEEDPDKVFLMYGDKSDKYIRYIELAKNRTGRVGEEPFALRVNGSIMRLEEI